MVSQWLFTYSCDNIMHVAIDSFYMSVIQSKHACNMSYIHKQIKSWRMMIILSLSHAYMLIIDVCQIVKSLVHIRMC